MDLCCTGEACELLMTNSLKLGEGSKKSGEELRAFSVETFSLQIQRVKSQFFLCSYSHFFTDCNSEITGGGGKWGVGGGGVHLPTHPKDTW